MKRKLLAVVALLLVAWVAWGLRARALRAPRPPPPLGEARGAWHVHTTRSDGRGTLDDVVRAARGAGLQFVVVTDHNVLAPGDQGYRDGVLVIEGTEASTRYGHVVALGLPRPLSPEERDGDPLGAIRALGGQAIVAHPLHPKRPFTGLGTGPWRGLEVVSNDTAWYRVLKDRAAGKAIRAALALPWDPGRAELDLSDDPADELALFDGEGRAARAAGARGAPAHVLLCSDDAHGWPSYPAGLGAFSMHVPVRLSGDAAADARAVATALLDGSAACVLDGLAPASGVRLAAGPGGVLDLDVTSPALPRARISLVRDGAVVGTLPPVSGGRLHARLDALCPAARCAPGDYRVEAHIDGRPWIFTNPVTIE